MAQTAQPQSAMKAAKSGSSFAKWLFIISVIGIVLVLGGFGWLYWQQQNQVASTPITQQQNAPAASVRPASSASTISSNSATASTCNVDCQATSECADSDLMCFQGKCRLITNVASTQCLTVSEELNISTTASNSASNDSSITTRNRPTSSDEPATIDSVTATPTPTPVPESCNQACTANADCDNSDHICYQGQCRLSSNPESILCSDARQQPDLPPELLQSGSNDVATWLKVGLSTLGVGALVLLLL